MSDALEPFEAPGPGRSHWVVAAVAVTLLGAGGAYYYGRATRAERIVARSSELRVDGSAHAVDRFVSRGHALSYSVALEGAPLGDSLHLECDWFSPDGVSRRHNRYKTSGVTHVPWRTHCDYALPADGAVGAWRVQMTLGSRILAERGFEVR